MSVFETTKKLSGVQDLDLESASLDVKININQLTTGEEQIPGYLLVKISGYQAEVGNIKFFGVNGQGEEVSGSGVEAYQIKESSSEELMVYFDISKLVSNKQFTDRTVEGVIKVGSQELGREPINWQPAIYLG
ncbi:hypothetical protein [Halanaerobaculum tunisiense]